MLLLLISLIHLRQASQNKMNPKNLFLGLPQRTSNTNIDWIKIQRDYQMLQLRYFKRLLWLSILLCLFDLWMIIQYHNAWMLLVELALYLLTLMHISRKMKRNLNA